MPALVSNRVLAWCGLVGIALIAVQMLRGATDLAGGAIRTVVLVLLLALVERVVLPVARLLVGSPDRPPR